MGYHFIYPNAQDACSILGKDCNSGRTRAISKVTPHHAAGVVKDLQAIERICETWKARGASANYFIDVQGRAYLLVPHNRRAWTSSNFANDACAITFEMSNCENKYPWGISQETYDAAVDLTAWICKAYGITPKYDGTASGTITTHRMFAATQCPGDYFVNEKLKSGVFVNDVEKRIKQWATYYGAINETERPLPPYEKPLDERRYYIQIGAYKNKANAEKQAAKASGYAVISKDGLHYVRKICGFNDANAELAMAKLITPKAFKGVV